MEGSLLSQGLELMLIGMGTVFIFLTLLVFATKAMSALALRLQPDAVAPTPDTLAASAENDPAVVAAIAAALHLHRSNKDQE